jgi:dTDP-L-rhamnose 4-epimerase
MANILITGGAGFIGSRLALRLRETGHQVTVLDNLSPQIHGAEPLQSALYRAVLGKVRFVHGDVCDSAVLSTAMAGQEVVVHLAAETGTGQSMYQIGRYCSVNVGGTANLLDLLANTKHTVKRFIVASSRAVYGEGCYQTPAGDFVYPGSRIASDMSAGDFEVKIAGLSGRLVAVPTDEKSRLHPTSVYGITKLTQEQLVSSVCASMAIEYVVYRYQNVFGPGQSLSNPYTGILAIFANLILQGKPINIFEDGLESRDFVFIDDVVDATVRGVERAEAANQAFNVGTGRPVTVTEVAGALAQALELPATTHVSGNFRLGDIRHNFAAMSHIREQLGFECRYSFDEGIKAFCAWVKRAGIGKSGYEQSLSEMRSRGLLK